MPFPDSSLAAGFTCFFVSVLDDIYISSWDLLTLPGYLLMYAWGLHVIKLYLFFSYWCIFCHRSPSCLRTREDRGSHYSSATLVVRTKHSTVHAYTQEHLPAILKATLKLVLRFFSTDLTEGWLWGVNPCHGSPCWMYFRTKTSIHSSISSRFTQPPKSLLPRVISSVYTFF